jgi:hypothetical protein
MSEFLSSGWRITHLGVVRLDFGDLMLAEVEMPWQAEGSTEPVARAQFAVQMDYANAVNEISFSRSIEYASAGPARDAMKAHNAALSGAVGDAVIESLNGSTHTLRGARLSAVSPRLEDGRFFACDYTLTGGQLDSGEDSTAELGDTAPLDMRSDLAGDVAAL